MVDVGWEGVVEVAELGLPVDMVTEAVTKAEVVMAEERVGATSAMVVVGSVAVADWDEGLADVDLVVAAVEVVCPREARPCSWIC